MSWFRDKSGQKPDYTGLQLQTSVSTLPIPIIWGQTKAAANVIWYANFQTHGGGGGKGGFFGGGSSTYTYTADLIMALCEGPITGIGIIWRDQSTYTLAKLGLSFFDGSTPQSAWGYLSAHYTIEALAYQGTSYVCAASYQLGDEADIGNHNFEIIGVLAGSGVNGVDADPAEVIADFLTNPQYGAGFSAASIDAATLYGSGGDASLQTYCKAMGVAFSPALVDQEQGSSILQRWLQLLNCAAVWSGGMLKFIPYGDEEIAAGDVTRTVQYAIPTPVQSSSGAVVYPSIAVSTAAAFVSDGGVVYAFTGGALTYIGAAQPSVAGTYGVSPAGTYLFAAGDENQLVDVTFTYAISVSYVPNLTPIYNLTDLDFVDEKGNKDPVQASRVDPFSLPTIQRVECLSRTNALRLDSGRGARSEPDRALRPARRLDDPGPRNLRRNRHRPDRRADHSATPALRASAFCVQAVLGVRPSRSDGHRDDHRRQSRPRRLSRAHRRRRRGRQGPAHRHGRGVRS